MYVWKTWFRIAGDRWDDAPAVKSVQVHRYRHAGWSMKPDVRLEGFWRLNVLLTGTYQLAAIDRTMQPGDAVVYPLSAPPAGGMRTDGEHMTMLFVDFAPGGFAPLLDSLRTRHPVVQVPVDHAALARLMAYERVYRRMVRLNRDRAGSSPVEEISAAEAMRHVSDLIGMLIDCGSPRRHPLVDSAIQAIEQSKRYDINASELAARLDVSRKHLAEVFRAAGMPSPGAFLAERRLARAQVLLAEGHAVSEVAEQLGYASSSNFSRLYRARTGHNPATDRMRYPA